MDRLPDELLLYIFSFLDVLDLTHVQQISRRLLILARDSRTWRRLCFSASRTVADDEASSVRHELLRRLYEARHLYARLSMEEMLEAVEADLPVLPTRKNIACWDPIYPGESHDYYEDFITRHARISMSWLDPASQSPATDNRPEVVAIALLSRADQGTRAISAFNDGSVAVSSLDGLSSSPSQPHRSKAGLLSRSTHANLTHYLQLDAVAGTDNVSVSAFHDRAYFAVGPVLNEVDLASLSLISSSRFPHSISALSNDNHPKPLIVGTNETVHIFDPRSALNSASPGGWETRIDSATPASSITLSERGPLSILHAPDDGDSIWIAGRFTSLLQHSLRHFPRLISTLHSGARSSCLRAIPYPYVPRPGSTLKRDLPSVVAEYTQARAMPGWTAVAAGEYKGKGSLELFGFAGPDGSYCGEKYLNRQTAARTRLLSVAPHCGKLVYSDGDGNVKWVERDGTTKVREYNINLDHHMRTDILSPTYQGLSTQAQRYGDAQQSSPDGQDDLFGPPSTGSDIVQKLLPFSTSSAATHHASEKLLMWTGDGRLAVLGYGLSDPLRHDEWHDAVEVQVESAAEKAKRDAEVQYQQAMRRALQRNADEVRFVRGLGLASA